MSAILDFYEEYGELFINMFISIANLKCPLKYSPRRKYDHKYYILCILDFLETSVSWRKYKGFNEHPINGKYLNKIHHDYINNGVYECLNKNALIKYLKFGKEEKLQIQSIDSSFVGNKEGIHNLRDKPITLKKAKSDRWKNNKKKANNKIKPDKKSHKKNIHDVKAKNNQLKNIDQILIKDINKKNANKNVKKYENNINNKFIQFNRYNGRNKYIKISAIVDNYTVPLAITTVNGGGLDVSTMKETIKKLPVNLNTKRNSTHNRYKQKMLADSGYSSKYNKKMLIKLGYEPIIKYNKKNTKNKKIIKKNQLTKRQEKIYKKRSNIESFFSWIKRYPVLNQLYEKTISSYEGLLLIAATIRIYKNI